MHASFDGQSRSIWHSGFSSTTAKLQKKISNYPKKKKKNNWKKLSYVLHMKSIHLQSEEIDKHMFQHGLKQNKQLQEHMDF
jgi:hypothetical protein